MKFFNSTLIVLWCLCINVVNAQKISIEEIWLTGKYRADYTAPINWANDGVSYYTMKTNSKFEIPEIVQTFLQGDTVRVLTSALTKEALGGAEVEDYLVSPTAQKLLFVLEDEPIYRRSSKANYLVYDCVTGKTKPLHSFAKGKISYPTFSPDGSNVAFVRNNNLFVTNLLSMKETSITSDGEPNAIINGACDWVYEEEFEFAKAFFWSPDGKKVAYYRFDEKKVKQYSMQVWDTPYPDLYTYKYPKVGEENSSVKLYCTFLESGKTELIDSTVAGEVEYFPRMFWSGNSEVVCYYKMNRLQNSLQIVHSNVVTNTKKITSEEKNSTYVEINDFHFYFSNSEDYIYTSERDGFRHLYRYQSKENTSVQLTSGTYEVLEVVGLDDRNQLLYFTSNEGEVTNNNLYSYNFKTQKKTKLTKGSGMYSVTFSPTFQYYTSSFSTANRPPEVSVLTTRNNAVFKVLTKNEGLQKKQEEANVQSVEFFSFKTTKGDTLNAWKIKPVGFNDKKSYPVLVTVYGGPGSQEVLNNWKGANYWWFQYLSQHGYMVVCVDGRGTGGRGVKFKKQTQLNLGKYESEDLIETAKYLKNLTYVAADRIGIFGWSFGGYLSSLAITKGADYFKTAIAVAPVTNWRYYDNIYTERYMGLPSTNAKGYDENAPQNFASKLKGNYLLIHGTADDNVHIQNAIEMQRALIKENKQFDMFYYPDKNHGIYGGNTRYHLYQMMSEYIFKKL